MTIKTNERPYLILTLRRTGGTSLMSFLSDVSPFSTVQHEPFNPDRIWHSISKNFQETHDEAALQSALAEVLESRPNVKHCFEITPPQVTRALIEACARLDYKLVVLTRRNEASRLRSLFLAQTTGAWGPEEATTRYAQIRAGDVTLEPIRPEQVRRRAEVDAASLGQVLVMLRNRNLPSEWVVFEELYAPDGEIATRARALAASLGMVVSANHPKLAAFTDRAGQGSSEIESFVPQFDQVRALLTQICIE